MTASSLPTASDAFDSPSFDESPRFTVAVSLDTTLLGTASAGPLGTASGQTPLRELTELVRAAEDAGAVAITLRDRLVAAEPDRATHGLDASIAAAALGPLTRGIGLIAEVPSAVSEPFHVATALQTVDHASLGRAALLLRPGLDGAEHDAVGRWPLHERPRPAPAVANQAAAPGGPVADGAQGTGDAPDAVAAVLRDADDTLEAITRLWDSWEADAVIRDVASGRFLDRERIHDADFTGERFSIQGASITPRSPQGRPPVVLRVDGPELLPLARSRADVVIIPADDASLRDPLVAGREQHQPTPLLWAELPLAQATPERLAELASLGFSGVQLLPTAQEQRPGTLRRAVAALTAGASHAASGTLRSALGLAPATNPHTAARHSPASHIHADTKEDSLV
ncbi:LLM class flavin-dependent oxidoreductase [Galactobacter caseinivorans]|uniref:LLM class flavin-dependent oxidoreductase n=1 Tax=Galactobacter caseinivorans TaxID=2676123 RepID=A0A496PMS6_9MICC|nr:LLM class flavin-dependent oxidoreductase [Galactobacter caseinivorans]RKW71835.1 LLM class flavin-dependent oxidoreductase [Galactobacter caseinivorans]